MPSILEAEITTAATLRNSNKCIIDVSQICSLKNDKLSDIILEVIAAILLSFHHENPDADNLHAAHASPFVLLRRHQDSLDYGVFKIGRVHVM